MAYTSDMANDLKVDIIIGMYILNSIFKHQAHPYIYVHCALCRPMWALWSRKQWTCSTGALLRPLLDKLEKAAANLKSGFPKKAITLASTFWVFTFWVFTSQCHNSCSKSVQNHQCHSGQFPQHAQLTQKATKPQQTNKQYSWSVIMHPRCSMSFKLEFWYLQTFTSLLPALRATSKYPHCHFHQHCHPDCHHNYPHHHNCHHYFWMS